MAKPERVWHVTKHEAIEKVADNLWTVRGELPGNPKGDRRMAIVRMADARLVFYNAIPLDDASMKEVAAWGKPTFLILPYNLHMMDGHAFQARLGLTVYGPKQDTKMAGRVKVTGGFEEFPENPTVRVESLAGMKTGEPVMIVDSGDGGKSLIFADAFMNIPAQGASMFARLTGMSGGPKVPWVVKLAFVNDKKALRAQLERLAELPKLSRLVPSHGHIFAGDAAGTLKQAAAAI